MSFLTNFDVLIEAIASNVDAAYRAQQQLNRYAGDCKYILKILPKDKLIDVFMDNLAPNELTDFNCRQCKDTIARTAGLFFIKNGNQVNSLLFNKNPVETSRYGKAFGAVRDYVTNHVKSNKRCGYFHFTKRLSTDYGVGKPYTSNEVFGNVTQSSLEIIDGEVVESTKLVGKKITNVDKHGVITFNHVFVPVYKHYVVPPHVDHMRVAKLNQFRLKSAIVDIPEDALVKKLSTIPTTYQNSQFIVDSKNRGVVPDSKLINLYNYATTLKILLGIKRGEINKPTLNTLLMVANVPLLSDRHFNSLITY